MLTRGRTVGTDDLLSAASPLYTELDPIWTHSNEGSKGRRIWKYRFFSLHESEGKNGVLKLLINDWACHNNHTSSNGFEYKFVRSIMTSNTQCGRFLITRDPYEFMVH